MKVEKLCIYDFDKTLYNGDVTVDFWKFSIKKNPLKLFYLPLQALYLVLWKTGFVTADKFKSVFFLSFPAQKENLYVQEFWDSHNKKINSWVRSEIDAMHDRGLQTLCISASPFFLVEKACQFLGIDNVIATVTESCRPKVLLTPNCKGQEKVRRLNQWAEGRKSQIVVEKMISDSKHDMPLYNLAKKKYYVCNGLVQEGLPQKF